MGNTIAFQARFSGNHVYLSANPNKTLASFFKFLPLRQSAPSQPTTRTNDPVIPVFVYQGKDRKWKGPLDFHDYLNWTDNLKKRFGKNVLNFCPKVLNIQDLDMEKDTKGLTSRPVLFTLKHIWRLDEAKVRKLFILGQELSHEEREALVGRAVDYMRRYDRNFSWKMLRTVEIKTIKRKGGRIMTPVLQYSLDEAQEKGIQKGWKKGWKEGMQQGMQ